jgi:hypothetical protein
VDYPEGARQGPEYICDECKEEYVKEKRCVKCEELVHSPNNQSELCKQHHYHYSCVCPTLNEDLPPEEQISQTITGGCCMFGIGISILDGTPLQQPYTSLQLLETCEKTHLNHVNWTDEQIKTFRKLHDEGLCIRNA